MFNMAQDHIFISQLCLDAIIGVHAEERLTPQTLLVDIELTTNTHRAAETDAVTDTIDYQQLADNLVAWALEKPCQLVETLANYLVSKILETTSASKVQLRLSKFPPTIPAAAVGVMVVRERTSPVT